MKEILKGGVINDGVIPGGTIGSPTPDGLGLNRPTDITITSGGSIYEFNEIGQPIAVLGVEPTEEGAVFELLPVEDCPDNELVTLDGNRILSAVSYDVRSQNSLRVGVKVTVEGESLWEELNLIILENTKYLAPTFVNWSDGGVIEGLNTQSAYLGTLNTNATDPVYSIVNTNLANVQSSVPGRVNATQSYPNPDGVQTYTLQVEISNRRGKFTFSLDFRVTEKDIPILLSPTNTRASEDEINNVTFSWEKVPQATQYALVIADNPTLSNNTSYFTTDTRYSIASLGYEKKVYYAVQAIDNNSNPVRRSERSATKEYTTKKEQILLRQRFLLTPSVGFGGELADGNFYVGLNKTGNNSAYKLKDSEGNDSAVFFSYATAPTGISNQGAQTGSNSGRYPDVALDEYFYTDKPIEFVISGLEYPYVTIRLLGSRADIGDRKALFSTEGQYRNGQALKTIQDNQNNVQNVKSFTDLQPVSKNIKFTFDNAPDVEFGYLNVIEIECYDKATGEPTDGIGENIPDPVIQPPKEPATPTITVTNVSETSQRVSWPEYTDSTYVVQSKKTDTSDPFANIGFPPAGVFSQTVKDLLPGTEYSYRVKYQKSNYFTAPVTLKTGGATGQPPVPDPNEPPTSEPQTFALQRIDYNLPSGLQRGKFDIPSGYKILWDNEVKAQLTTVLGRPGHAEEKAAIEGGDDSPVVRAMRYLRTGNVSEAVSALNWAYSLISGGGSSKDSYGPSSELAMAALIFSWCKKECDRADTPKRSDMVALFNKWCYQNTTDQYDSPIMPTGTKNAIFSNNRVGGRVKFIVSHHMSHLSAIFLMSIAIADDDDTIYKQVRDVLIDEMVPAKVAMQQGGAMQGVQYSVARQGNDAMVSMVLSHIAKANGQSNTKYFPEDCFQACRVAMYCTKPNGQLVRFGDTFHYPPSPNYEWVRWLISGAAASRDREVYDFAYTTWYNGAGMLDDNKNGHVFWAPLLLAQKDITRADYTKLPTFYQSNYPAGVQVLRGTWAITKNSDASKDYHFATFFNANVNNHLPHAQGAAFLHYLGTLETMSGAYSSSTGEYGSEHVTNWFQMTPAYSAFYSQNPNFTDRVRNGGNVRLGGQMFNEPPVTLEDVQNRSYHDAIKVSRMHTEDGIATAMIDTTQGEDSRYAQLVRRIYVSVESNVPEYPIIYFTQDYYINKDTKTTNAVLAHGIGDITADNSKKEFTLLNRESYKGMTFEGKEVGFVFGNGDVFTWEGYHSERNSLGNPSGTQYPPGDPKSSFNGDYWKETSGERADIRTTGRTSSEIKIWRSVGKYDAVYNRPTERTNGAFKYYELHGVMIGVMDAQAIVSSVSFNVSKTLRVVLLCLDPNTQYKDQNGKKYTLKGGFLFDETLSAGSYTLTKV